MLIPTITENTDTVFNMYFENAAAGQSAYYSADDVWTANYVAVYYLNGTLDFSGNGYDLDETGGGVVYNQAATGSIGLTAYFSGGQYIGTSEDAIVSTILDSTGSGVMCQIKDNVGGGAWRETWHINYSTNTEANYMLFKDNNDVEAFGFHSSVTRWDVSMNDLLQPDRMDFISWFTGTIGGIAEKMTSWIGETTTTWSHNATLLASTHPSSSTGRLTIGADAGRGSQFFTGWIDTFIILNNPLNEHEAYLWAFNMRGEGLIDYGPRVNLITWVNATTEIMDTTATLNGYLNSSNQDEINCGFIYGRTSPVTEGNADANVTAPDLYNATDSFEYNISSLTPGDVYYVKAWSNDSDGRFLFSNESSFFTHPGNASSLEVTGIELGVRLEWVHGTGYDVSVLVNATSSYPSHPSNGTEIYNGTATTFEHTGLTNNTQYYYSLWEWSSDSGFSEHSIGNQTASIFFHSFQVDINTTTDVTEFNVTLNGWFTGAGLSGSYTCGFWYGSTYPLTESSKEGNVTAKTDSKDTNFTYNLTGLLDGELYWVKSWIKNATAWETSSHSNFTTNTSEPTSLTIAVNDNLSVSLSWSKTYDSPATTVIVRLVDAYPGDWSDGTIIYNGTGTSYADTDNNIPGSHWYYRVWGHVNPFSVNYSEDNIQVAPFPPSNITTNILTNSTFDMKWDTGTGAATTMIRRKLNSYPTGITDGTEIYNSTGIKHNVQDMETSYYYTLWSYANETYSTSVNITVGGIVLYCFDEDTNETLDFDIFISNDDGSQTHERRNVTNGYILNVSQLPLGDAVKFVVSTNQNYSSQSESFYYGVDENQTITYVTLLYPPRDKISTNVTCINESGTERSFPSFTLSGDIITILPDDADNFTRVIVNYTYYEYQSRTYYRSITASSFYLLNAYLPPSHLVNLYLLEVSDQYDEPLEDAYIEVKNKVNNTYVIVSSLYTDAAGQADLFLMEFDNYIFVISKDGYTTENASWTPGDIIFTHPFKLNLDSDVIEPPELGETITLRGVINDDNTLDVTFVDKDAATLNTHFYVEEYYNKTFTYRGEYNGTTESSITFSVDIDNFSKMHVIRLYMNHSNLGYVINYTVYVMPIPDERDEGNWLENLARSVLGDFDYGYVVTVVWVIPCILLLAGFGSIHQPGMGILGTGMWSGWIAWYIVIPNEADILAISGIALLVAFIVIALKQGKKVVHE